MFHERCYDSTINTGDPPAVSVGETVTFSGELYTDGETIGGSFVASSFGYDSPVDGVVTWRMSAESTGEFTLPGASGS